MDNVRKPKIMIGKKGIDVELCGLKPEEVTYLAVYCESKNADLGLLSDYPNVETLFVNGEFAPTGGNIDVDGISALKRLQKLILLLPAAADLSRVSVPTLKSLTVYGRINSGLSALLTDNIEYLELKGMRGVSDLSFIEGMSGLKKLYLDSMPAVERLPDFGKMPNLYGLKVYELHKLNDIGSLTRSDIRFLDLTLAADKLSGTKIAEILLQMPRLERFSGILDRNDRRDNVLENRLEKAGKSALWEYFDYDEWTKL
ncbi:MAG: hypothetical protein NC299_04920 [Lachnospiraceae bacterium]|nr:hypothetical protein [Ruminococcus sp.]MCM1274692.1 hypothetical protein [Lachnospiraceae bacterium]